MTRKKELTNEERTEIFHFLLEHKSEGSLARGTIGVAAEKFQRCSKTISNIWKRAKRCYDEGMKLPNVDSLKKGNVGRKKKDHTESIAKIKETPQNQRGTIRGLSAAIEIPKSTLGRMALEKNGIYKFVSSVKPSLSVQNARSRLEFCKSMLKDNGYFEDMLNRIHIDEKWFYITKVKRNYYLALDENTPHR